MGAQCVREGYKQPAINVKVADGQFIKLLSNIIETIRSVDIDYLYLMPVRYVIAIAPGLTRICLGFAKLN
jgi:hypothetical protein